MALMKCKDRSPASSIDEEDGPTGNKKLKFESSSCDAPLSGKHLIPDNFVIDPSLAKVVKDLSTDPLFKKMGQHLRTLRGASAKDSPLEFDLQAYLSAKRQVEENPELLAKVTLLGNALMKEPYTSEDRRTRIKAVLAEAKKKSPDAIKSCWIDKEVLLKLREAMHVTRDNSLSESDGRDESEDESEDEYDEPMVHTVAINGDVEGLMKEISTGANINEANEWGLTALHFACYFGKFKCARALLKAEVDKNVRDKLNNTPLHYAAAHGWMDCVHLLLSFEADDTLQNTTGNNAKDLAVLYNHFDVVEALDRCGSLSAK